jgi:predicted metal-dependent phosphoesterase TrpH
MHSDRSDGRYPPEEALARAARGGLDVIALSDHDLDPVLAPGLCTVEGRDLRVIAAVEMSGHHAGREFHLLVYFPGVPPPEARAFLRMRAASRAVRFDEALSRLGVAGSAGEEAHAGLRALTRFHLAAALTEAGRVRRPHDAWNLLGSDTVPLIDLAFVDAIRHARAWGGVTSWAHPTPADAQRYLPDFVRAGLEAVEAARPNLDRSARNGLKRLAKRYGLLVTGGSDWHGWWQGELGDFRFDDDAARAFLARLDRPLAA